MKAEGGRMKGMLLVLKAFTSSFIVAAFILILTSGNSSMLDCVAGEPVL
jgi:hypothetical protein